MLQPVVFTFICLRKVDTRDGHLHGPFVGHLLSCSGSVYSFVAMLDECPLGISDGQLLQKFNDYNKVIEVRRILSVLQILRHATRTRY